MSNNNLVQTLAAELAKRFVGAEGIEGIREHLEGFVKKDGSKVLSEKDFTAALEAKLKGIMEGAEVNKIDAITVNDGEVQVEGKTAKINITSIITQALTGYLTEEKAGETYQTKAGMNEYYTKSAADQKFVDQEGLDEAVAQQVGKVYRPMGSKASFEEIKKVANPKEGDVWNALDTGANYAYTAEGEWDKLSETVDLTPYLTIKSAGETYQTQAGMSQYPTTTQVEETITGKGYQTADQVNSTITSKGYQTAGDVSSAIESAIGELDDTFATDDELSTAIEGLGKVYQTQDSMKNYYNKTEADAAFIDEEELAAAIEDMLTSDNLGEALGEIFTEISKAETLSILNGTAE